ncbi:MAG: CHAT domain-containing protein [Gaiellales bacterium]
MNPRALPFRNLAHIEWDRGDLEKALEHCLRALDVQGEPTDDPDGTIELLHMAAHITANQGDLDGAVEHLEEALAIGEATQSRSRAQTLALLSGLYETKGEVGRAAEFADRSMEVAWAAADGGQVPVPSSQVPGDYGRALHVLERALAYQESIAPRSFNTAHCLVQIGTLYGSTGDPDRGLEYLRRGLELFEDLAPASTPMTGLLQAIALQEQARGNFEEAAKALERAAAVEEAYAQSWGLANCFVQLGVLRARQERLAEAEEHMKKAADIFRERGTASTLDFALCLHYLGSFRFMAGDHGEAEKYGTEALRIFETAAPNSENTVIQLTNMGVFKKARGELTAAIEHFERAITTVEHIRSRAGTASKKEELFALRQSPYQAIVACLFERNGADDHARAFHYTERSRARALVELLAQRRLDLGPTNDEQAALVDEERRLQERLAATYGRLSALRQSPSPVPELLARVSAEQIEVEEDVERVRRRLLRAFPAYGQLTAPDPLMVDQVQQDLEADTLVLEYDATGEETFVFAIKANDFGIFALGLTAEEIGDLADRAVGAFRGSRERSEDAGAAVGTLSERLVGVVPSTFWDGVERVVVVPDGTLNYLPFELLTTGDAEPARLLDRYTLAYAPSATVVHNLRELGPRKEDWPAATEFVGFGDPAFADDLSSAGADGAARGLAVTPLPGTRLEVEGIAGGFDGRATVFLGDEATESQAKSATSDCRFLHFATHGILDDTNPLYAGLLFAPPRAGATTDTAQLDDFLQVYEIFGLRLSAEVVVCSACQTGLGKIRDGEGLISMSRAFFFAGARCVVVSLWPVPDLPTARLMQFFYEDLRAGKAPAAALRSAKLRARDRYADPYSWAGFIVVGLPW